MKIQTDFETCIICTRNPVGNWEHIIPASIGGRLQARILCTDCNSRFGAELVSSMNKDPAVRYAYEHLKEAIPDLYKSAQGKATFVGKGKDGSLIRVSNNLGVLSGKGIDGSIILNAQDTAQAIPRKLQKANLAPEEIQGYIDAVEQLPTNEAIRLPTNEVLVKLPLPKLYPEIGRISIGDRLMVLIAYEYLSLLIHQDIYHSYFEPVRRFILDGEPSDTLAVKSLRGETYSPYHVLDILPAEDSTTINVRLFRLLTWAVTFQGYQYQGLDTVYMEDIESGKSLIAPTRDDASHGNYYCGN